MTGKTWDSVLVLQGRENAVPGRDYRTKPSERLLSPEEYPGSHAIDLALLGDPERPEGRTPGNLSRAHNYTGYSISTDRPRIRCAVHKSTNCDACNYPFDMSVKPDLGEQALDTVGKNLRKLLGAEHFTSVQPDKAEDTISLSRGETYLRISDLAKALNRSPRTIHRWVRDHTIPDANHRTPIRKDRQWTPGEVNLIVTIASEENILANPGVDITRTNFSVRVWEALGPG